MLSRPLSTTGHLWCCPCCERSVRLASLIRSFARISTGALDPALGEAADAALAGAATGGGGGLIVVSASMRATGQSESPARAERL
jgi:hypothetical protein